MEKIKKISFSTGGIKGISFIGAVKALEKRNIIDNIKYYHSSVGSLIALLLSIGYKSGEMFTTLKK